MCLVCTEEDNGDEDEDDLDSQMDNSEFAPVDAMSQDGCEQEEEEEEDEEEYETMTLPDPEGANYDDKYDYKEDMDALEKLRGKKRLMLQYQSCMPCLLIIAGVMLWIYSLKYRV